MKGDKEKNYFSLRIMFRKCLFPMLKCTTKSELFNDKKYINTLYTKL